MLTRRGLITGLVALVAAPAVVRTPGLLMPVKGFANTTGWVHTRIGAWKKGDMSEWLYVRSETDVLAWAKTLPPEELFCGASVFSKPTFGDNSVKRYNVNCGSVRPNNDRLIDAGAQHWPMDRRLALGRRALAA